jgi:hypothetical protein
LRTRIGGVLKPLDGGTKTFQCHKPIDTGASVNLVPDTRPDPQKPNKPVVVVDPKPEKPAVSEPKIGCANGKVKDGACTCEPNFKPVKAGKNAWRCVADAKPETRLICTGGKVSKGECVCGKGMKPVKAGDHAFRCVKSAAPASSTNTLATPTIACKGGKVQGSRCMCPTGTSLKAGECTADSRKAYGKKAESKAGLSNGNSLKRRTR